METMSVSGLLLLCALTGHSQLILMALLLSSLVFARAV